jgi:hypothetical protein
LISLRKPDIWEIEKKFDEEDAEKSLKLLFTKEPKVLIVDHPGFMPKMLGSNIRISMSRCYVSFPEMNRIQAATEVFLSGTYTTGSVRTACAMSMYSGMTHSGMAFATSTISFSNLATFSSQPGQVVEDTHVRAAPAASQMKNFYMMGSLTIPGIVVCQAEDGTVLLAKPPKTVKSVVFGQRLVLHSEAGPVLEWEKGLNPLYAINGVAVPAYVVLHPDRITTDEVIKDTNLERRNVLIRQMGHEKFLKSVKAKKEAKDDRGILWSWVSPDRITAKFVEVLDRVRDENGKPKKHFLRVPPNTRTPKGGVAWTFGLDPKTYQPEVET